MTQPSTATKHGLPFVLAAVPDARQQEDLKMITDFRLKAKGTEGQMKNDLKKKEEDAVFYRKYTQAAAAELVTLATKKCEESHSVLYLKKLVAGV